MDIEQDLQGVCNHDKIGIADGLLEEYERDFEPCERLILNYAYKNLMKREIRGMGPASVAEVVIRTAKWLRTAKQGDYNAKEIRRSYTGR